MDKRAELIEELKVKDSNGELLYGEHGDSLNYDGIADFILERDKKNASEAIRTLINTKDALNTLIVKSNLEREIIRCIDATLTNLGVESKEK